MKCRIKYGNRGIERVAVIPELSHYGILIELMRKNAGLSIDEFSDIIGISPLEYKTLLITDFEISSFTCMEYIYSLQNYELLDWEGDEDFEDDEDVLY